MDEQVEKSGIDENPQDVGRTLDVEALAQPAALRDQIADDTTGTDPTFRPDRLEDVADLGIGASSAPYGFVDRCESRVDSTTSPV